MGGQRPVDTEALIRDHLDLVRRTVAHVAARYPRHVDREELWNAGALGLVEAASRYDPDSGTPFERYAKIRIRGAIIDSTRNRDWATRSLRRQYRDMEETSAAINETKGREPDHVELAAGLGVSVEQLHKIRAQSAESMLLYLDYQNPEDGSSLRDAISNTDDEIQPEVSLEHREMLGTLRTAIDGLPPTHAEVIRRYYLDGEMLQGIANDLGVTQARVSQIRSEALTSMRAWFGTMYEGTPEVADDSVGMRARAAYLALMASQSSWRSRLAAADQSSVAAMAAGD